MKSQYWEIDDLKKMQLEKLKFLVITAYNKSNYYKKLYDSAGVRPEMIQSLEDIKYLPVVSKEDLLRNKSDIQLECQGKSYFAETSGSTGEPLVFYRDKEGSLDGGFLIRVIVVWRETLG
jgi:phenylacetate-CoA ligase